MTSWKRLLTGGLASVLVSLPVFGQAPTWIQPPATDWWNHDWPHRKPIYVDSAQASAVAGQPLLLEGYVDTEALGLVQGDLDDLRFTSFDPVSGNETLLQHFVSPPGQNSVTQVWFAGFMSVKRGSGVTDALYVNGLHERMNPVFRHGDRVYIAYVARPDTDNDVMVLAYDETTGTFLGPVKVADLPDDDGEEAGEHRGPALIVDPAGFLHVTYGSHGFSAEQMYRRSLLPEDITAWTPETFVDLGDHTFPSYVQLAVGDHLIFTRTGTGAYTNIGYNRSTNGGASWGRTIDVLDTAGDGIAFASPSIGSINVDRTGQTIHMTWSWENGTTSARRDVLYNVSDDGGLTWKKADGTPVGPVIRRLDGDVDVVAAGPDLCAFDVDVDAAGRPHVVYRDMVGTKELFHAVWDGATASWIETKIDDWGDSANVRCFDDSNVLVYAIDLNANFDMAAYRSGDGGLTWEKVRTRYRGICGDYGPLFVRPALRDHAQATVYMYYGNPSASDGAATSLDDLKEFTDKFPESPGADPASWSVTETGTADVSVVGPVGCFLDDPDAAGGVAGIVSDPLSVPYTHGYFRARVRLGETGSDHTLVRLHAGPSRSRPLLVASAQGDFRYDAGGGLVPFPNPAGYVAGTTYTIELFWDTVANRFRALVDEVSLTGHAGLPIADNVPGGITSVALETSADQVGTMLVDDVEIYGTLYHRDYDLDLDFEQDDPGNGLPSGVAARKK